MRPEAPGAPAPTSPVLVLDGAMGTELDARGVPMGGRAWSADALETHADVVARVHADYAAAGATVHTANTFRTTRRAVGPGWHVLARRAVELARRSVPAEHRVAGAVAPLEDCYRPDLSPGAAAVREHAELARVLVDAGVDLLLCETFANEAEACAAVAAAARTGVETWAALTAGPDASLLTPEAMSAAAVRCVAAGATMVLVNCTPARVTLRYLEAIAGAAPRVGAYANAGGATERMGWGSPEGPALYATHVRDWLAAGAGAVGGCCGTGPGHVEQIAAAVAAGRVSGSRGRPPVRS